ncbi:hypothetical protein N7G274_007953 [Stereocaulon virgatum]|uniref:BZIP domain-containing protein n=1 Tax=Stereocaulon virgatum TaxID=373712 RepID=A0ABR4A2K1_9LECA
MDDAESARRGGNNDECYQYSPLGIFNDSYFTQPLPFNDDQNVNFAQGSLSQFGMNADSQGATNYAGYEPYQIQASKSMDLNVLSAEDYREGPYSRDLPSSRVSGSTQVYGGLLVENSSDVKSRSPPADITIRRSTRKEVSKSTSADETGTRQRGRPRLDNRDQTATERRRTQIRLAQRAYRQRKETTISGLNRRVTSLESTIEDMNKAFLEFSEKAFAAGIQKGAPALAKQLALTADLISGLAKNSKHESDNEEENEPNLSAQTIKAGHEKASSSRRTKAGSGTTPASMLGYQTTFEEEPDDYDGKIIHQYSALIAHLDPFPLSDWTTTEAVQQYQNDLLQPTTAINDKATNMQQCRVERLETSFLAQSGPSSDLEKRQEESSRATVNGYLELTSLPLPRNNIYHETSFARRLMRGSAEAGIRILINPDTRAENLEPMYRFTWCFANSSEVLKICMATAPKTAIDGIEDGNAARLHLGGAGLRNPRDGVDGAEPPPAWWLDEAPLGPRCPVRPGTPMPDNMAIAEIIQTVQVAGDWPDSRDVEQHLREKGIYLDGRSFFVEITEPDTTVPELHETQTPSTSSLEVSSPKGSTGGPLNPQGVETDWSDGPFVTGTDYNWAEDIPIPDVKMESSYDQSNLSFEKDFDHLFDFSQYTKTMPTLNAKMKKFLDVDKFLNILVSEYTCILRTAGFRRANVGSVLTSATIEQF